MSGDEFFSALFGLCVLVLMAGAVFLFLYELVQYVRIDRKGRR